MARARPTISRIKTLHVLRHAKSDWSDPHLGDHERPLNDRGLRSRALVAAHVRGWPIDLVLCSTAARARATAEPIIATLDCPVRFERSIYDDGAAGLLDLVRTLPDDVDTALLVGHNPSMEQLTTALTGTSVRYPTAALGTILLAIDRWSDAGPACGSLAAHVTPQSLQRR